MRRLQIENAELARIVIQQEIGRNDESRYYHRLHGLLLLAAGHSCRQVAALFGEDDTTVQRWVRRFSLGGLSALREGERSGRPPALDQALWTRLEADLRSRPSDFGFAAANWDGPTLSKLLHFHYGVELGVRQCQRICRRMRLRQHAAPYRIASSAPPDDGGMTTANSKNGTTG